MSPIKITSSWESLPYGSWTSRSIYIEIKRESLIAIILVKPEYSLELKIKISFRTFLVVQHLRLCTSTEGSIPGWGTKIPHAMPCGQKKKKDFFLSLWTETTEKQKEQENENKNEW